MKTTISKVSLGLSLLVAVCLQHVQTIIQRLQAKYAREKFGQTTMVIISMRMVVA